MRRPREAGGPPGALGEGGRGRPTALLPVLPLALVAALAALRLAPEPSRAREIERLDESASRAYAAERWEEAAEYARRAVTLLPPTEARRAELLCVLGEALLRAGHAREAVEPFTLVAEGGPGPHRPQALYSGAVALEAAGDEGTAAAFRRRLREEHRETPWTRRLGTAAEPARRP